MMKRKFKVLFFCMLLVVGVLMMFSQQVEAATETKGQVKILSVTPNSNLTPNTTLIFEIKVSYSFDGIDQAILYAGFNNKLVNSYALCDKKIVSEKSGEYTFKVSALVKDWGSAGDFQAYANISEYPHPSDWTPIDNDKFSLAIGKAETNTNSFNGITKELKTITSPKKPWTIKFTGQVSPSSINSDNIYISDEQGNKISVTNPVLLTDQKSVSITPLEEYKSGNTYYLYIRKDITSSKNKNLKTDIRIPFVYIWR